MKIFVVNFLIFLKIKRKEILLSSIVSQHKGFIKPVPCRYSNIVCSGYPLGALDSIQSDGSTNWSALKIQWLDISKPQPWQYFPHSCSLRLSAMYLILNGPKEEHLNMLEGGIIAKLLDEKWSTFAKAREMI